MERNDMAQTVSEAADVSEPGQDLVSESTPEFPGKGTGSASNHRHHSEGPGDGTCMDLLLWRSSTLLSSHLSERGYISRD